MNSFVCLSYRELDLVMPYLLINKKEDNMGHFWDCKLFVFRRLCIKACPVCAPHVALGGA